MGDKELENRKRCLKCKYYGCNTCPLMADGDVFTIDICVLDIIREKNWDENSPEMFMFKNKPVFFMSYISFLRKEKLPNVGNKVLTLHGGFGSFGSRILYVSSIDDRYIELADYIVDDTNDDEWEECDYYLSNIDEWYKDLFVFDDNN